MPNTDPLQARVDAAVDALPNELKLIIVMRWRQHLTVEQIAATFGIAPWVVRMDLQIAVEMLRHSLSDVLH